ncbi:MAG: nucleoside-diphosphate kinase [Calditrichia bacterium]|nr:nucleoside-diphosphate kinase [Calditrichia bacterium]
MAERTLAILKPDCIRRNLAGKVLDNLLDAGFKIVALKMVKLTKETAGEFYAVHNERPFYNDLLVFMTETKVIPMILEKQNAVTELRKTIGATDPAEAEDGTIRKLYAENKQNNIIHASDSVENARIEISFFFSAKEIIENDTL